MISIGGVDARVILMIPAILLIALLILMGSGRPPSPKPAPLTG